MIWYSSKCFKIIENCSQLVKNLHPRAPVIRLVIFDITSTIFSRFSVIYFSHRRSARVKKRMDTLLDHVRHFGAPSSHFGESVPPAPLGWYFNFSKIRSRGGVTKFPIFPKFKKAKWSWGRKLWTFPNFWNIQKQVFGQMTCKKLVTKLNLS